MFVFEPSLDLNGIEHRLVVAVNQRTDPMCTVLHFMTPHFQTPPASDARIPIHQRICHSIRTTETEMPESDVTAWRLRLPARARSVTINEIPPLDMKDSMAKLFRAGKRPLEIL